MKPNIGIPEKKLKGIVDLLAVVLADEVTLYTKTRKFHWNVYGQSFMEFHKLFEAQYNILESSIDEVAERISKLGSNVIGTMKEFAALTTLKEHANVYPSSEKMLVEILNDHESIIIQLRKFVEECSEKYKDAGTTDFLTGLILQHETMAWTLRRYLK